jgi:hypothetical protein
MLSRHKKTTLVSKPAKQAVFSAKKDLFLPKTLIPNILGGLRAKTG